jgi:5-enolpyruvylshikimate-3-phosphate synthase
LRHLIALDCRNSGIVLSLLVGFDVVQSTAQIVGAASRVARRCRRRLVAIVCGVGLHWWGWRECHPLVVHHGRSVLRGVAVTSFLVHHAGGSPLLLPQLR